MSDELFEAYLNQFDDAAWTRVVDGLLKHIHPVDRTATPIWFAFFPLALHQAFEEVDDRAPLLKKLQILGRYRLADQIDSSHGFLYGHRYWLDAKRVIVERERSSRSPRTLDLIDQILELAAEAAVTSHVDRSLLAGITAVALMTRRQVGFDAFAASPGLVTLDASILRRTPEQVLAARARDDGQGLFGFLKGDKKTWTVTFSEQDETARFPLIHSQHLTTAAGADTRDHRTRDPRCSEGPIPVECRTATCGTCWIGVLGGAEKLSPLDDLERKRLREFGYLDTDEDRPIIRLSCMAQAYGAISIVIPPWNGIVGKFVKTWKDRQAALAG
ncbi:MAG TPA: hypothetical protein VIC33_03155 [Vicinamibacterales bacterium]|jgi:ferredoxin